MGVKSELRAWAWIQEYCADMAKARAVDDDQYQFQRDKLRWRREVTVEPQQLEAVPYTAPDGHQLDPGQELIMELALGHLSPKQRPCFEMVVGAGMTSEDAAKALRITPAEVRTHLARAREKMATAITPRLAPGPPIYTGERGERALMRLFTAIFLDTEAAL